MLVQAQIATGDVVLGVGEDAAGEQRGGNGERSNALQLGRNPLAGGVCCQQRAGRRSGGKGQ
jgi:hypothetical protein